jgi:branched-chain amino acid transport system ATP-binding protein
MLSVDGLRVVYGGLRAVDGLALRIPSNVVHGLIGPNGAGKSTAVNAISGVLRPQAGSVRLNGTELVGLPAVQVLQQGLARTFQQAQLWSGMTVEQNLFVPVLRQGRRAAALRAREVAEMLGFAGLLGMGAGELPFGARRLVEVGRAMMARPSIILLDEPGAGLTPMEKQHLVGVLELLAAGSTSVLLIDHDMDLVMSSCAEVTVLDAGRVIATGPPEQVRGNPDVVRVYLGGEAPA